MKTLPRNTILQGDARTVLEGLLPESVDAVVTSPPYFQLRDYGTAGQLGLEGSVEEWVGSLRQVLSAVARVLKPTGSLWLNLGDSYSRHRRFGAPPKSLIAAPERLLMVLMEDGWILRNKLVWAKTNPMPHSVGDRLNSTYDVVYFLTRSPRYFFDLDSIREPHRSNRTPKRSRSACERPAIGALADPNHGLERMKRRGTVGHELGKNPGDVWTLPIAHCRDAHFATFPAALVERPILATVPERICVQCDTAWRREVTARRVEVHGKGDRPVRDAHVRRYRSRYTVIRRLGKLQRCDCFAPTRPGVVLDPFMGSGTVAVVAERLRRDWLGIELNPEYVALAERRLAEAREEA